MGDTGQAGAGAWGRRWHFWELLFPRVAKSNPLANGSLAGVGVFVCVPARCVGQHSVWEQLRDSHSATLTWLGAAVSGAGN